MDQSAPRAPLIASLVRYAFLAPFFLGLLLFAAFFLIPVGRIVATGLFEDTLLPTVVEGYFTRIILFTYTQALLSTVLSFFVGAVGAYLFYENRSRRLPVLARAGLVCFSMPSLVVVLAILAVWGRSGWWAELTGVPVDIYGLPGIVLANAFFNFPLFLLGIGAGLRGLDRQWEQTSLSFGASRIRTFFTITLRRLWPGLRGAMVLAFLYSSATSFVVALFFGGGPAATTLEVAIYQAMKMDYDPALAARLALVSLGVSLTLYLLFLRKEWFTVGEEVLSEKSLPLYAPRTNVARLAWWLVFAVLFGAVVLLPLFALVYEGAAALPALEGALWSEALHHSLVLALMASVLCVPTALGFAYAERLTRRKWLRGIFGFLPALPLAASTLLLSVGLLLSYPEWMAEARGSLWPIAIVQALGALPLVHRTIREALFRVPQSHVRTAQSFGAMPFQVMTRVELPAMSDSLAVACLIAMASSLGEVAAVLLFSPGEVSTLSVELFRAVGRYRFQEGFGFALILIVVLAGLALLSSVRSFGRKRVTQH